MSAESAEEEERGPAVAVIAVRALVLALEVALVGFSIPQAMICLLL